MQALFSAYNPEDDLKNFLEGIIRRYNAAASMYEELFSYAYCRYSCNTGDNDALFEINRLENEAVRLKSFMVRFRNVIAGSMNRIRDLLVPGSYLADFAFFFEEQLRFSRHQMSPEMEELAADLSRSGADSWSRLQESISSSEQIVWDDKDGSVKTATQLRALAFSPDPALREKAWRKEIELWKKAELPLAFALNGVKGFSSAVNRRRNHHNPLERAEMQARLSPETLDTLISVMQESLPVFRRYLKAKAGLLGKERLAFYDLFAPLGAEGKNWNFAEAAGFISGKFRGFSPELGDLADRAFEEGMDRRASPEE